MSDYNTSWDNETARPAKLNVTSLFRETSVGNLPASGFETGAEFLVENDGIYVNTGNKTSCTWTKKLNNGSTTPIIMDKLGESDISNGDTTKTISFTAASADYDMILVYITVNGNGAGELRAQINGVTGSNYRFFGRKHGATGTDISGTGQTYGLVGYFADGESAIAVIKIPVLAISAYGAYTRACVVESMENASYAYNGGFGLVSGDTQDMSSFKISASANSWRGGKITVWGLKNT
ncbi:MAG: hypothetical protein HZC29_02150 [Thaumarchaeota archaeon]|nr:hypothetical protein [Nitrososphaerota archaeon]